MAFSIHEHLLNLNGPKNIDFNTFLQNTFSLLLKAIFFTANSSQYK